MHKVPFYQQICLCHSLVSISDQIPLLTNTCLTTLCSSLSYRRIKQQGLILRTSCNLILHKLLSIAIWTSCLDYSHRLADQEMVCKITICVCSNFCRELHQRLVHRNLQTRLQETRCLINDRLSCLPTSNKIIATRASSQMGIYLTGYLVWV